MAAEQTTIVVAPRVFGFTSLDEAFQTRSDVPRAEFVFADQSVISQPVDPMNLQAVVYELELPFGFAYVIVELTLRITDQAAEGSSLDWGMAASLQLRDGTTSGNSSFSVDSVGLRNAGFDTGGGDKPEDAVRGSVFYEFNKLPTVVVIARDPNGLASVAMNSLVDDGAAVTARIFARFLQYDIRQAHHYQVNTPTLVR